MTEPSPTLAADELAALAPPDTQRQAARMAQDVFAQMFRLTLSGDVAGRQAGVNEATTLLRNWARAGGDEAACGLRLAFLVAGMDQWGLAYSQAFGLQAIPCLSELLGALRAELDPRQEALFECYFGMIDARETNAIDFKVELRRAIHLALWAAMISSDEETEAKRILEQLRRTMLALIQTMPTVGWRLVADALAHIQIRCLAEALASEGLARETTEGLFDSLSRALPKQTRDPLFAHAAQVVMAWQQARRQAAH